MVFVILQYDRKEQGQPKLQHLKNAMSTPYIHKTSNGNIDYEDFPQAVPFLQTLSPNNKRSQGAKKKRYRKFDNKILFFPKRLFHFTFEGLINYQFHLIF